jgi:type I restriction enzyme S subunit
MVIKEGYKQTEIGVIPEDWECNDLQKYFSLISYGFTNPMPSVSDGIFMITANDVNEGRIKFETARKTTEVAFKYLLSDKSKPKKNDILLTKDGSLGRLALVGDEKICINQSVAVIRPNQKVYPLFLKLLLEDSYYQKTMIDNAGGSTIKHIYITIVNKMLICVPPTLTEQTAIATALSDADGLITGLEKLIAKKRNIKQGAMQQLLQPNPEVSGGWEVKKLGEVAEMYSGGTPLTSIPSYYNGNIPWVVIADITKAGKYISETEKTISQEGVSNSSAKLFKKGVLLFAMYASIGKTTIALMDTTCNQAILGIEPKSIDKEYLYYFLSFNERHFITMGQTGTQSNLSKDMVQKLEIPFPKSKEEQTKIAAILSDMDAELSALEEKLEKYKKIKLGMMQELLTGKIRLV